MVVWNDENAAHLLARAGFGGSASDVRKFAHYGQANAVEALLKAKPTSSVGPGKGDNDAEDLADLRAWWVKRMVKATSRRLPEKMTLFWHDHFATSVSVVKNNRWMALQNRTLRVHGLGPMKTLVYEVTRDPAMLDFLDGNRNRKGKPNENYGREVMELFVLGVSDLNGVENYTQTDVVELARCLTGFVTQDDAGVFDPTRFDTGTKTLFAGKSYQASGALGVEDGAGNLLPPAQNVIDILFTHRDSDGALTMPRFIAKKLWEHLAYPAPAKTLLDELTADFIANGFVVADLLRAMFLRDEFYSQAAKTSSVKNPCEYAFHAIRALRAKTNASTLPEELDNMGMALFDPPNVNGWRNGLAWLSSGQFLARVEFAQTLAAGRDSALRLTPTRLFDRDATDAAAVVDDLLAALGVAARVPPGVRQALVDYFEGATDFRDTTVVEKKVRGAIALMLSLPEFQVH
ncbi:MAG TPA: DUF1800 domain-containing protein [Candidatus Binatia bacterium]|nr:DUF1800 domain-containing protein [Candidatus Binatia bacterium]